MSGESKQNSSFNPHHKWLGISPNEFPYDHYRLLAIGRFENDPDVIENAADQRMAHLRRMAIGSRSDLAEALLNELSAAKLELLTPDRKQAYDAALKAKDAEAKKADGAKKAAAPKNEKPAMRTRAPQASGTPVKSLQVAAPLDSPAEPAIPDFGKSKPIRSAANTRVRRKSSNVPIIAALIVGVLVLGGGALFMLNRPSVKPEDPAKSIAKSDKIPLTPSDPIQKPLPSRPVNPAGEQDFDQPKVNSYTTNTAKLSHTDDIPPSVTEPPAANDPPNESPMTPSLPTTAVNTATLPHEPESLEPERKVVPNEAAQKAAREKVQGIFALDKSRKADERAKLAEQLLDAAAEIEDPAERYVVLDEARSQAAQGANVTLAIEAVKLLGKNYDVSESELALEVVSTVRVPNSNVAAIRALLETSLTYLSRAAEEDKFATGEDLAEAGVSAARRLKDTDTARQITELKKQLGEQAKRFDAVVAAKAVLEAQPDDPKANGTVGRYHALFKGDWPRGLSHLTKSDDEVLAKLAQRDLAASDIPADLQSLAADWWKAAEQATAEERAALYGRAGYWYEQVFPHLEGVERTLVEKRLKEAEKMAGAKSSQTSLPREQLIAHWKFDEPQGGVFLDSAGNHPVERASAQRVPGVFGTALQIEELSEYVARAADFHGVIGSNPRTIAFWLRAESVGGIVSWGDESNWWIVHLDHEEGGKGKLRISANGYARSTTQLDDGRWHHVAVVLPEGAQTHDGLQIYVDGKLEQTTVEGSKLIETGEGEFIIGTAPGIRALSGAIDELRIYARGLSEDEIARLARPPAK